MSAREYRALVTDIGERGLLCPLEITAEGIVLAGRERLRVACELGLEELPVRAVSPADEIAHMLLAALSRRHLTPSQKAALAIELAEHERRREKARRRSRANLRPALERATLPARGERPRELTARLAGVSARTIQAAQTVKDNDPKLFERLKAGPNARKECAHIVEPDVGPRNSEDRLQADTLATSATSSARCHVCSRVFVRVLVPCLYRVRTGCLTKT